MPVGNITRGTTNANRLRRVDRWIQTWPALRTTSDPLVIDLGYGASAATPVELATRLRKTRAEVELLGLEIDPERVTIAKEELSRWEKEHLITSDQAQGISFARGGFEVPVAKNRQPVVIRAFNVLRQYDEPEVQGAWDMMVARLQPGGVLVEGTCDEIGRISSWIAITTDGPQTLSIALKLDTLEVPSIVAERLPKALIHHNVPGERIHEFLTALDKQWLTHAPLGSFGATQRWIATAQGMKEAGWPIIGNKSRWRLGEITVAYEAVSANAKAN
ncbi:class I SAM-dependent methyltransferase [Aurantimicrobium minutum]|uniref:class I SAM-dependent methyltransferase n=1 Tax=Aurantimicrobium minutum TaxID=708131 RepID=UPI002404EC1C|nr:class I SAM-dependent methyltransferase [Aurantimicrobium minutum]